MKNSVTYFFIAFLFLVTSCSKDDNNENLSGNASTVKTTIIGRVFDESGAGLSGADVYIGNKTASTNLWGIYVIEDAIVAKSRSIITVKKAGYWDQVGTFKPKAGGTSSSNLCLYSSMNTHTVNAVLGGTITTIDGASIQFPVDAFEKMDGTTYTGTVALTVHHLSRSANLFSLKAPGTDFKGKSLSNTIENLVSFGMIGATLKDGSGNELKLKNGKKATISLPVHAAQQAIAAPSIPLWHFNEVTALWEEEGTALYNGSMYTAEVSHFSWWNCDVPGGVLAHGYVFDCNNAPYANASIENDDSPDVISDINGYWSGLIEPNSIQKLQAISYSTTSTDSSLPFYTPSLPDFSNLTVPDFHLLNTNCVVISGNVNNCAGQATPATILVINNNQLMNYYYSTNGIFNFGFPSLPPSTIQIIVYKDAYSTAATFNYNGTGNIVAGTLSLCDTTNYTNDAVLIFTNTQIGNISFSLDVTHCFVNFLSGNSEITMDYNDSLTGNASTFTIKTPLYANGIYPWNNGNSTISGSVYYGGIQYWIQQNGSGGSTSLSNAPLVGGQIKSNFSGPVTLNGGPINFNGTLSGTINAYRNN